jgi:CheY-like chemotaxis protein
LPLLAALPPGAGLRDRTLARPHRRKALARLLKSTSTQALEPVPEVTTVEPSLAGRRVLVAEDNPVNQALTSALLRRLGLEVVVVGNGLEALEHLKRAPVDLVLMDCLMPGLDGYEATRGLRAGTSGEMNSTVPVIALTASALAGDRERCLEAGMTDYLSKPIRPQVLRALLERYLSTRPPIPAGDGTNTPSAAGENRGPGSEGRS